MAGIVSVPWKDRRWAAPDSMAFSMPVSPRKLKSCPWNGTNSLSAPVMSAYWSNTWRYRRAVVADVMAPHRMLDISVSIAFVTQ